MPWRVVVQPNHRYAIFSTIVDNFTAFNMNREEALETCLEEIGRLYCEDKVARAERDPGRWQDCLNKIEMVHGTLERAAVERWGNER